MGPKFAYVWPKDPRPGNPSSWPRKWRLMDVLTGKGPDIYVERIRPRTSRQDRQYEYTYNAEAEQDEDRLVRTEIREPKRLSNSGQRIRRTGWSLWEKDHLRTCHVPHCRECDRIRLQEERDNFFAGARRDPEERYDFRMRKYIVPDVGSWSGKVYCDDPRHVVPRCFWDPLGRAYPSNHAHDMVHGAHEDRFSGYLC